MPKSSEADLYEFQSEDEDGHQMQPGELEGVGVRVGREPDELEGWGLFKGCLVWA